MSNSVAELRIRKCTIFKGMGKPTWLQGGFVGNGIHRQCTRVLPILLAGERDRQMRRGERSRALCDESLESTTQTP